MATLKGWVPSPITYQPVVGEPLCVIVEIPLERLALQPLAQGLPLRDVAIVAQSLRLRLVILPQPEIKCRWVNYGQLLLKSNELHAI